MTHPRFRRVAVLAWLGVAVLLAGCGPGEVRGAKLKGRVVKDGKPLKALPGERVWVTFEHADSGVGGKRVLMTTGQVQKDGTFTLDGQEKKGTPPGKYSVMINGEFTSGEGENRFADLFPGGQSPFTAEVTGEDGQTFVIDLDKKTVTKE